MIRSGLVCTLSCLMLVVFGCAKSDEPRPQADAPINGLMPSGGAVYDGTYLADQTQVKTLPARAIPEDSLLGDAVAVSPAPKAPKPAAREVVKPSVASAAPAAAPMPSGSGGFWQRIGSKAIAASMSAPQPAAVPSDDADDEDKDDATDDEDENEEEDDDEEED